MTLNMPLMDNNISDDDLNKVIEFLETKPILTQSKQVESFEKEWSSWLGVKYSVFVNSGSSANFLTMAALKYKYGVGEIIVPTLTWVSDIASVMHFGFTPVFVDINPKNLCMSEGEVLRKITKNTKAVFLTHVLGFNGLSDDLISELKKRRIPLIEDVCEAHGATHKGKKLGTFGLMSNFSFYYAHHMTTIEGGMVSTDSEELYNIVRMLRSHGMVREAKSDRLKKKYAKDNPSLNPQFIFAYPGFNMRSTEINAVLGRSQLKLLDIKNASRRVNFTLFLWCLDKEKYRADFDLDGSCNYAFVLILKKPSLNFANKVMKTLDKAKVEYRRGLSGGGNQLRQPYLENTSFIKYPNVEHVHWYGFYIGNSPYMSPNKIDNLCKLLNSIKEK